MNDYTPVPWRVVRANPSPTSGEWLIAGAKPGYIAELRDCGSGDIAANALRIVSCVNACDGIGTEELEGQFIQNLLMENVKLRNQAECVRMVLNDLAAVDFGANGWDEICERAAMQARELLKQLGGAE